MYQACWNDLAYVRTCPVLRGIIWDFQVVGEGQSKLGYRFYSKAEKASSLDYTPGGYPLKLYRRRTVRADHLQHSVSMRKPEKKKNLGVRWKKAQGAVHTCRYVNILQEAADLVQEGARKIKTEGQCRSNGYA